MQQSDQVLSVLVNLKASAEHFAAELQQNLAGVDTSELQQIAAVVYAPSESQISRSDTTFMVRTNVRHMHCSYVARSCVARLTWSEHRSKDCYFHPLGVEQHNVNRQAGLNIAAIFSHGELLQSAHPGSS